MAKHALTLLLALGTGGKLPGKTREMRDLQIEVTRAMLKDETFIRRVVRSS